MKALPHGTNFTAYCSLCRDYTRHKGLSERDGIPEIYCTVHDLGNGCYKQHPWWLRWALKDKCKLGIWKIARPMTKEEAIAIGLGD